MLSNQDGYEALKKVLDDALSQASQGKGRERHAGDLPFHEQPIMTITRSVGAGFPAGQALKKIQESIGMDRRGNTDAAYREVLGAIVYAAALAMAYRD